MFPLIKERKLGCSQWTRAGRKKAWGNGGLPLQNCSCLKAWNIKSNVSKCFMRHRRDITNCNSFMIYGSIRSLYIIKYITAQLAFGADNLSLSEKARKKNDSPLNKTIYHCLLVERRQVAAIPQWLCISSFQSTKERKWRCGWGKVKKKTATKNNKKSQTNKIKKNTFEILKNIRIIFFLFLW